MTHNSCNLLYCQPIGALSYSAAHMASAERFGERLREWRQRRRVSQQKLGEAIGADGPRIHRLEKGQENPTLETLDKLAEALKIDASELLRPSPEETDRAGRNPLLASRWDPLLEALDAEVPAEDSWRGDVLKALAALNRALRRPNPGEADPLPAKAGR